MLRKPGTESRACTRGSSVVPGLAKQISTPPLMAVATNASAPFMWLASSVLFIGQDRCPEFDCPYAPTALKVRAKSDEREAREGNRF
jgi:hypothetical protein